MSDNQEIIEGWAIIELFGYNKIAGHVSTVMVGGSGLLRVDVPETESESAFTCFYGPGAIYRLTLVTEELARLALRHMEAKAITVYIPRQLPMPEAREFPELNLLSQEEDDCPDYSYEDDVISDDAI